MKSLILPMMEVFQWLDLLEKLNIKKYLSRKGIVDTNDVIYFIYSNHVENVNHLLTNSRSIKAFGTSLCIREAFLCCSISLACFF